MTQNAPQLTATNIRYLITIYNLGGTDRFVKCTDIAKDLSVTRPSVHAMVKTLTDMNLIEKPRYGKVNFTAQGKTLAQMYMDSYNVVRSHFDGIVPENADMDAVVCAFMSQVTTEQLADVCRNIKNIKVSA